MTLFLETISALFFIICLKQAPWRLSKKKWTSKMQTSIEDMKKSLFNYSGDTNTLKAVSILTVILFQLFACLFYITLGTRININYFSILTVLELLTVIFNLKFSLNEAFSVNIEDYVFRRWYLLLNVILDFIYYPIAIYLLIMQ